MHTAITKAFKRYHLFGFTGTPIFAENAGAGGNPRLRTTEQAFGDRLHTYTIVDAINDKNVLPFRIDYVNTIKLPADARRQAGLRDRHRAGAARARADRPGRRLHPRALRPEDEAQLQHYTLGGQAARGLQRAVRHRLDRRREALLRRVREAAGGAAGGAAAQGRAHLLLRRERGRSRRLPRRGGVRDRRPRRELARLPRGGDLGLQRACSARASTPRRTGSRTTTRTSRCGSRTASSTSSIVVNMFLTGFDATTLNTLWVDKGLRAHGLIQAYSRTNRILNSVKTYGNIVTFRDLEEETNDALALFGNKDAQRHRPAQAVRRLLRRVRRAGRRAAGALPARRADRRGERAERVHPALRRQSCGCATS